MAELETQLLLMTQDMERDMIQKNEERDAALAGAALAASHTSGGQAPELQSLSERREGRLHESDAVVATAEEAMHAMERMALQHQGVYQDLNAALLELGHLAEQTQQDLSESRLEVSCLHEAAIWHDEDMDALAAQVASAVVKSQELETCLAAAEGKVLELQATRDQGEKENLMEGLQQDIKDKEGSVATASEALRSAQEEVAQLMQVRDKNQECIEALQTDVKNKDETVSKLTGELQSSQEELKQRESLLQSSHEEAQQTCILNKSRELEMTKSKSQLERVGDQLQAAQAQLQIAQARLLESERELMVEREEAKSRLEVAQHNATKAQDQVETLTQRLSTLNSVQQELETSRNLAQDLERQISMS